MNPDTDPIAEVEAWLIGKMYPYPACLDKRIGPAVAESALLGLGVAWLRDNSNSSVDTPMSFAKASGRPYLANVYAAIADVKRYAK